MTISGLQKLSLIDYPGKLACAVFIAGCSFRCPWCYSPELVIPEKIRKGPQLSKKEFFSFLRQKQGLLEAVVLCGGEPTINPELPRFCQKIKEFGYAVKLDTNGINPRMLKQLIDKGLIDYLAMDVKAPKDKYMRVIGLEKEVALSEKHSIFWRKNILDRIETAIELLKQGRVDYEFRTTIIPDLVQKQDVLKIAQWLFGAKRYILQGFRPGATVGPEFQDKKAYGKEYLIEVLRAVEPFFESCELRM